jgi:hypothetical protein
MSLRVTSVIDVVWLAIMAHARRNSDQKDITGIQRFAGFGLTVHSNR